MKLLNTIFQFRGNIPSVCGIRLGESYDEYYDLISSVQNKETGDRVIDYCLEENGAFIDVDTDLDGRISEITISYYPLMPFSSSDMEKIASFFRIYFEFTKYSSSINEDGEYYNYDYSFSNDKHSISLNKDVFRGEIYISITSVKENAIELQGANIYFYHEPTGMYGVKSSNLGLSITRHPGTLSREDVIENLLTAMKLDNEYGNDWHSDYAYQFLHQEGMIIPIKDELLEDEDYIRQHAETMTDTWDVFGSNAQEVLNEAGVGENLVPIEEIFKEELLEGEISNLEEYIKEMRDTWTLGSLLPYMSLDY